MQHVLAAVRDGRKGIMIAGPPGAGKTRLAADCASEAARSDDALRVVHVYATPASADLPLGCFATFLPAVRPAADRTEMLRQIITAIAPPPGARVLLVVDDAHLLDPTSAALTHQLALMDSVFLLTTLRSRVGAPDPIIALWKDRIVERIELSPLSEEHVGELVETVIGGPMSAAARRLFFQRSAGNVFFLRELILAAVAENRDLRSERGSVYFDAPHVPTARLVELIEARLAGLDRQSQRAAALLALGEPLGVSLFVRATSEDAVAQLEENELLRSTQDGRRMEVRLSHPMFGEAIRKTLSPRSVREHCRALAEILEQTGAHRRDDILRLATWRLWGGVDIEPGQMLAAARRAWALHDPALAEDLARAAVAAGAGFDARLLLATILTVTGRAEEAEQMLDGLTRAASTDRDRAAVAFTRLDNLSYGLGDLEKSLEVVDNFAGMVSDPVVSDEITTYRASLLKLSGRSADAAEIASALVQRSAGRALVWGCIVSGSGAAYAGRFAEAIELAKRGFAAHQELTVPVAWPPAAHLAIRALTLTLAGELDEAKTLSQQAYERGVLEGAIDAQLTMALPLCMATLARGEIAEAVRWGEEAAALARAQGRRILLRAALIPLAEALAYARDVNAATRALDELEGLGMSSVHFMAADLARASGWVQWAAGDESAAAHCFDKAADIAMRSGAVVSRLAARHDLVRLGKTQYAAECVEIGRALSGPLPQARAEHAAAKLAADPPRLEGVSTQFATTGAFLLAAEAAADAAAAWEEQGDERQAAAVRQQHVQYLRRCAGYSSATVNAGDHLNRRQGEIARLARQGMSNRDIAGSLSISVRTVENHLHAVYKRLGIRGRAELPGALDAMGADWGTGQGIGRRSRPSPDLGLLATESDAVLVDGYRPQDT